MSVKKSRFTPFIKQRLLLLCAFSFIDYYFLQCLVAAAVSTNMVGHGCGFGVTGILLPQLKDRGSAIILSKEQASWIASVGSIPMIFGNFLVPALMSRAGRKPALYTLTLAMLVGWLAIILATDYKMLLIGRIFQGLSFGMFMPLRSIYVGECSSPRYRGGFLSATALAQSLGICFVHLTGSFLSYQLTALCSISFPFISILLTIYSPESPSWLATRGKYDKCRNNFIWLRGEHELPELDELIISVKHFDAGQNYEQNKFRQIVAVAKKTEFFKPVFLMSVLFIMQNYAGGPVMASYATTVLELLMGPEVNAHFWMVALDFQRLLCAGVAIFLINKIRRRKMVITTGFLSAGSQLAMGAYVFARTNGYLPFDSMWIPGILINVQVMSGSMGLQPLPAVIAGEVFPLQHRGLAGSIGLITQCASILVVLKAFPGLIASVGLQGTYTLYAGVIVTCLAVAWVMLPETSGRTLQQIEEHFRGAPIPDPEADGKEMQPLNGFDEKPPNELYTDRDTRKKTFTL